MKKLIGKLLMLVLLLSTISACFEKNTVYIPHEKELRQLEQHALGGNMNCTIQAWRGQILLQRRGEKSCISCGFTGTTGNFQAHCWNEVFCKEDNKWHLIDLSTGSNLDGWPLKNYYEYVSEVRWYGTPTKEEVIGNKNPDWQTELPVYQLLRQLPTGTGPGNDIIRNLEEFYKVDKEGS